MLYDFLSYELDNKAEKIREEAAVLLRKKEQRHKYMMAKGRRKFVVMMKDKEGKTFKEIADYLGGYTPTLARLLYIKEKTPTDWKIKNGYAGGQSIYNNLDVYKEFKEHYDEVMGCTSS